MGTMNRTAYEQIIRENLEWVDKQPRSLESDHIRLVLKDSIDRLYGNDYLTANKLAAISTACMCDTPVSMAASLLPAGHALDTPAYRDAVRTVQKVIDLRLCLEAARKSLKAIAERSATPWVVQEATDGLKMSEQEVCIT